jgi:DNA-3-methyladenine glycosylase I
MAAIRSRQLQRRRKTFGPSPTITATATIVAITLQTSTAAARLAPMQRCGWVPLDDPLYVAYHDEEWGVPEHDDRRLFELLTLEGAQAGLSWSTILHKRVGYRAVFEGFDPARVAQLDPAVLLGDARIVRNRLKVESTVSNARAVLELGSLDDYLWEFVGGEPIVNRPRTLAEVPAQTELSRALSKDLKKRGFRFVGPTVCYAFMQATGLVDDHVADCFRATPG